MRSRSKKELFLRIRFSSREDAADFLRSLWPAHQPHILGTSVHRDGDYHLVNWEMRTPAHSPLLMEYVQVHPAIVEWEELTPSAFEKMSVEASARHRGDTGKAPPSPDESIG